MAGEFKIKNGFLIGDQTLGEYSVAVSGVVDDLTTSVDHDIVTGPAIQGYVDAEITTLSGYVDNEIATISGVATNLNGLSDVTLTSPASGEYLKYDGSNWINIPISGVDNLTASDVTIRGDSIHEIDNVQHAIEHIWSATTLEGFDITLNEGTSTVAFTAGTCILRSANANDAPMEVFDLDATSAIPITNGTTQYIFISTAIYLKSTSPMN